jgi:UDP-glucose 4-epimerase
MKVIVTGGAGFIGSHVCDLLIEKGFSVVIFDDLSTGRKEYINRKATFTKVDITDARKVINLVSKIKPGCIFHLAAWPRIGRSIEDPIGTHKVNVIGTLSMLEAAKRGHVPRFIYSSSSSVYGKQKVFKMKEDMEPNPISHYALQKLLAEKYCTFYAESFGMEIVTLRYFNVYGKRQPNAGIYALVLGKFLDQHQSGKKLTVYGDGKQTRDYTFVRDVARANLLSMMAKIPSGRNTVINIGSSKETSVNQIVNLLKGVPEYIVPNPRSEYEERRKVADIHLAKETLGWKPTVMVKEGLNMLLGKKP